MIIAFASTKGGVGKSTACATLAYALADRHRSFNEKVLAMDLDPNTPLYELHQASPYKGLDVWKCSADTFSADFDKAVAAGFEHILIDLAGFLHTNLLKAFYRADLVIVPLGASQLDLRQAEKTVVLIHDVAKKIKKPITYRLLLTRLSTLRNYQMGSYITDEIDNQGLKRFSRGMVERQSYKRLFAAGEAPHESDPKANEEIAEILGSIMLIHVEQLEGKERARA